MSSIASLAGCTVLLAIAVQNCLYLFFYFILVRVISTREQRHDRCFSGKSLEESELFLPPFNVFVLVLFPAEFTKISVSPVITQNFLWRLCQLVIIDY